MSTLNVHIDAQTENGLRQLSQKEGNDISQTASRLLARAVRAARPRRVYDVEAIRVANAPFQTEDEALAESDRTHRADLLAEEDRA
jgi:hypothetical protein